MGKVPAALKAYQFKKGASKSKSAGKKGGKKSRPTGKKK